jgi:hypothetical protein
MPSLPDPFQYLFTRGSVKSCRGVGGISSCCWRGGEGENFDLSGYLLDNICH